MRLKTIKLAGFKSFVDPTTIVLQSNLTAVVGPNGCGKSNVVDAIRWVIGESSAKQLRGESLTDVIFNGTTHRKPVGQASIELTFDNSDGSLGGEYASYSEISIRRELNRDGQSNFYLNNTRCRRRDIVDVFLGTGLGPRSYAIIEQGMISELIEAKPEDIRIYLEEAAGISIYKERRRRTESGIASTRENLARLTDLREEIEKQLNHLKRQANTAERFKVLKQEQRLFKGQLNALHCQSLDQQLSIQQTSIRDQETHLESKIAEHRHIDTQIEKDRIHHTELNDAFNEVQGRYYKLGADIARQEQQIQHIQERERQLTVDLSQLENSLNEVQQQRTDDEAQIQDLRIEVENLEPLTQEATQKTEQAQTELTQAEQLMNDWQAQWEQFSTQTAQVAKSVEVEQTRLQQLTQRIQSAEQRKARIQEQQGQLNPAELLTEAQTLSTQSTELNQQLTQVQNALAEIEAQIAEQKSSIIQAQNNRDVTREQLQSLLNRKASLEAAQQVALGKTNHNTLQWLEQQKLHTQPRLAEGLRVDSGWETAVETVLGSFLEAVCVEDFTHLTEALDKFNQGRLSLMNSHFKANAEHSRKYPNLASKVKSKWPVAQLLENVYVAEDLNQAQQMAAELMAHESVITADAVWLGNNWLRIAKESDEKAGVIQRNQELETVNVHTVEQQTLFDEQEILLTQHQNALLGLEKQREELQQQYRRNSAQSSEARAKLSAKQAQLEQIRQRESAGQQELNELQQQLTALQEQQTSSQELCQKLQLQKTTDEQQRNQLLQQRENYRAQLNELRQNAQAHKHKADEYQVRINSTRSQLHFLEQNITRNEKQLAQLQERQAVLTKNIAETSAPIAGLQAELEDSLKQRLQVEEELKIARDRMQNLEHQLRQWESQRNQIEIDTQSLRNQLEQLRMEQRAMQVRRENYLEQIIQADYQLESLVQEMPPEADMAAWQQKIEQTENKIQRLGPINLAAIEEHDQLAERKTYLDNQNNDLVEALNMLEDAIRKIDRESRARLQETFDKANDHFKTYFPKIFGGGQANLELTGDDVLTTGVLIKAQPPGKRNSSIHLLSGGEKALTAISLVFSLFQLNPAPFCILDEVDAPLDDANVNRFCSLVKEMSEKVQFIFISHNKVTMEMAQQLAGITMNEPGVSRLVSVDISEAIAMAEQ